jgi:hypothetical protein
MTEKPKTAEEIFAELIMEDVPAREPAENDYSFIYLGSLHRRLFGLVNSIPESSPYSAKIPDPEKDVTVVPLRPYKGPVQGRLDRQAVELRRRLSNPKAVMLVLRGKTYSAESVWGVVWLYLKTKFFKRWTKKHYPSLATT